MSIISEDQPDNPIKLGDCNGVLYKKRNHPGLWWRTLTGELDLTDPDLTNEIVYAKQGNSSMPSYTFKQDSSSGIFLDEKQGIGVSHRFTPLMFMSSESIDIRVPVCLPIIDTRYRSVHRGLYTKPSGPTLYYAIDGVEYQIDATPTQQSSSTQPTNANQSVTNLTIISSDTKLAAPSIEPVKIFDLNDISIRNEAKIASMHSDLLDCIKHQMAIEERQNAQSSRLSQHITSTSNQFAEVTQHNNLAIEQIASVNSQINTLTNQVTTLADQVTTLTNQLATLNDQSSQPESIDELKFESASYVPSMGDVVQISTDGRIEPYRFSTTTLIYPNEVLCVASISLDYVIIYCKPTQSSTDAKASTDAKLDSKCLYSLMIVRLCQSADGSWSTVASGMIHDNIDISYATVQMVIGSDIYVGYLTTTLNICKLDMSLNIISTATFDVSPDATVKAKYKMLLCIADQIYDTADKTDSGLTGNSSGLTGNSSGLTGNSSMTDDSVEYKHAVDYIVIVYTDETKSDITIQLADDHLQMKHSELVKIGPALYIDNYRLHATLTPARLLVVQYANVKSVVVLPDTPDGDINVYDSVTEVDSYDCSVARYDTHTTSLVTIEQTIASEWIIAATNLYELKLSTICKRKLPIPFEPTVIIRRSNLLVGGVKDGIAYLIDVYFDGYQLIPASLYYISSGNILSAGNELFITKQHTTLPRSGLYKVALGNNEVFGIADRDGHVKRTGLLKIADRTTNNLQATNLPIGCRVYLDFSKPPTATTQLSYNVNTHCTTNPIGTMPIGRCVKPNIIDLFIQ